MKSRAFTLIELLVVVLIIGILSAIALPQYRVAVLKARYTQLITSASAIKTAILSYHLANNTYPTGWEELDVSLPGTIDGNKLEGKDYVCYIHSGPDANATESLRCHLYINGSQSKLAYRWYYYAPKYDKIDCEAAPSDDIQNRVCKAVGGKLYVSDSGGVNKYKLNY